LESISTRGIDYYLAGIDHKEYLVVSPLGPHLLLESVRTRGIDLLPGRYRS
jgi:hypothetical protein